MKAKITELRSEGNVRKDLGDLKELASSFTALDSTGKPVGIIEPLVVKKNGAGYIVLAGHRRLAAAKLAGLKEVPVHVVDVAAADIEGLQLIENLQRKDLTDVEEARGYLKLLVRILPAAEATWLHAGKKLLPSAGWRKCVAVVAKQVGRSACHVERTLRLLELPEKLLKLIDQGKLLSDHGRMLLTMPKDRWDEVVAKLEELVKDPKDGALDVVATVEDAYSIIDTMVNKTLKNAPFPTDKPFAGELACTACPFNTANQTDLIPGIDQQGYTGGAICRQSSCWQKKREQVYKDIRDSRAEKPEVKGLSFGGFARLGYNDKMPEAVMGKQVVTAALMPEVKKILADPKRREAIGWALVKPQTDSKAPEVKQVLIIKDPTALAGTKGVKKAKEAGAQAADVEGQKRQVFNQEVGKKLHYLLVLQAFAGGKRPKAKKDWLDVALGHIDSDADFGKAFEVLGIRPEKKVEATLRGLKLEHAVYAMLVAETLTEWRAQGHWRDNFEGGDLIAAAKIPKAAEDAGYKKFRGELTERYSSWDMSKPDALAAAKYILAWTPETELKEALESVEKKPVAESAKK